MILGILAWLAAALIIGVAWCAWRIHGKLVLAEAECERIDGLNKQLNLGLTNDLEKRGNEIEILRRVVDDKDIDNTHLRGRVRDLEAKVKRLELDLDASSSQYLEVRDQLFLEAAKWNEEVKAADRRIKSADAEIGNLKSTIEKMRAIDVDGKKLIAILKDRIEKIKEALS